LIKDYLATDIPTFDWPNFNYMLRDVCSRFSGRTAFRYRSRGARDFEEWSYERLGRESAALASFLLSLGLARGDRVAIWSENRPEWGAAYMAIVAAGLVAVPIDALLTEEEVARVLRAADARAAVASGRFSGRLCELLSEIAGAAAAIGLDGLPAAPPSGKGPSAPTLASWAQVADFRGGPGLPAPETIAPEADASIIFTSGTTGAPKGVVLSHAGIIANFDASIHSLPISEEDVFMCVLPLHHTYPTTCSLVSPLAVGAAITIVEKIVGRVIVDDVSDTGGTVMIAVPILYDKLAQALDQGIKAKGAPVRAAVGALRAISRAGCALGLPGLGRILFKGLRARSGLGSLRLLVAGGGPLSASTARVFDELGFCIVQGYGMSENGPLISTNTPRHHDHSSAGLVVKRTEVRIADRNEAAVGEIQVRSPSLMKGYWKDPEATAAIFTEDGWLRTGDIGRIDRRGFIYITGRIKSLIVTAGGKNIYPEEIEALFEGSRVVREALVLGKPAAAARSEAQPRGDAGAEGATVGVVAEEVAAVLVPDLESIEADRGADFAGDAKALRGLVKAEVERVNRSLPPYKKISDFHLRAQEFEKTSSRKIKRYLYKTWAEATGEKPSPGA
jgi:long-chain acyl-CoA synthetase